MDIATIIGLAFGLTVLLLGTITAGLNPMSILDIPSILITFGGGIAATVISTSWSNTMNIVNVSKKAFSEPKFDIPGLITTLVSFSEKARREGLLALEDDVSELPDEFLRKGIQLVVDGTDPELVRNIMETEMSNIASRHSSGRNWWDSLGGLAPGFGMLGTLIGLIGMLKNMGSGDSSAIGIGMAAALITTLYGSFISNLLAIPMVKKLMMRSEDELSMKQIMIEGTLSIQSGDNPRIVKEKLSSFLSPSERGALKDDEK
ncbi:MAG: motility protein A [Leptospiraceae bacterium]|nr:motility protein A [Leptospiraceae bacterium]MCK6381200.1 motility protein A [Leptospiraceae bacterium]NUM42247.1 motility protein A [Leptospiraceae bacterium]